MLEIALPPPAPPDMLLPLGPGCLLRTYSPAPVTSKRTRLRCLSSPLSGFFFVRRRRVSPEREARGGRPRRLASCCSSSLETCPSSVARSKSSRGQACCSPGRGWPEQVSLFFQSRYVSCSIYTVYLFPLFSFSTLFDCDLLSKDRCY